jgi:hypothetical protein
MALLTAGSPTAGGLLAAPAAMATSNTIAQADIGQAGALLRVINGAVGSINVTISDPNTTALGNAGTTVPVAVANGTAKTFRISPSAVNQATGVATVAISDATTITYELQRL